METLVELYVIPTSKIHNKFYESFRNMQQRSTFIISIYLTKKEAICLFVIIKVVLRVIALKHDSFINFSTRNSLNGKFLKCEVP